MDDHFLSEKLRNKGRPWLSNLIIQLWDLQFQMWEHRNKIKHSDITPAKLLQLDVLRTQSTEELEAGCLSLQLTDKHLFKDEDKVANFNLMEMKQWLLEVHLARDAANHEFIQKRRSLSRARAFMRDWLNTTRVNQSEHGQTELPTTN